MRKFVFFKSPKDGKTKVAVNVSKIIGVYFDEKENRTVINCESNNNYAVFDSIDDVIDKLFPYM